MQVNDLDAILSQPLDPALEIHRLAHDDRADVELADEAAAIPARRERGDHDLVAIGLDAPRVAESVRLAVHRGVVLLDAPVVPAPQNVSRCIGQTRADRDAALGQSESGFGDGDGEEGGIVHCLFSWGWKALTAKDAKEAGRARRFLR